MMITLFCFVIGVSAGAAIPARVLGGLSCASIVGQVTFPPTRAGRAVTRWTDRRICRMKSTAAESPATHPRSEGSSPEDRDQACSGQMVPSAVAPTPGVFTPTPEAEAAAKKEKEVRVRRIGSDDQNILYFAYGANMSPAVLTEKRGVKPFASWPAEAVAFGDASLTGGFSRRTAGSTGGGVERATSRGRQSGLCLCFCHRAGYATIATMPGPPQSWKVSPGVHGVLHVLSPSDLARISNTETGYRRRTVEVETPEGIRGNALCFVSHAMQMLPTSVPPTSRYLSLLQDGASYHGVDERYREWLEGLPTVSSRDAQALPERTNTASKALTNAFVTILAVALIAGARYSHF